MSRLNWRPVALALALTLVVAGCNNGAAPKGTKTADGSTPTAQDSGDGAARARAATTVLDKASMLPKGWLPVPTEGRLSGPPGRPAYCGVSVEPKPIRQSALVLYEEDPTQRRVLQYTFVSTERSAKAVMDKLRVAASPCREVGFTVDKATAVTPVGDDFVALDYRTDSGATSRTTIFRARDTIIVLVAYGTLGVPTEATQSIAAKIDELLAG